MKFNAQPFKVVTFEKYQEAIEEIRRLNEELKKFRFYGSTDCSKCENGRVTLFTKGHCLECESRKETDGVQDVHPVRKNPRLDE